MVPIILDKDAVAILDAQKTTVNEKLFVEVHSKMAATMSTQQLQATIVKK